VPTVNGNNIIQAGADRCRHAQAEGKASKMLEVVPEEKRREIIKEGIDSGRIKV